MSVRQAQVHPVVFAIEQAWAELMAADRAAGKTRWRPRKTRR